MMAVFLAIASSLMDSGFKQALIRIQDATQADFNTAFYANLGLGAIAYSLLFFSALLIAGFYQEPRLIILIRVAGLNVLIHAFQVIQSALLSREMNFKAQLQATIPASVISGIVAVGLAYFGFGVWALIIQMLLSSLITTLLLWHIQGWRPTRGFSRKAFTGMYHFGYKLFIANLSNTLFLNIYIVVIAKLFTATVAGQYFFAEKLKDIVLSLFVGSVQQVTYPALSSLQNDESHLKAGFRRVIQVTTFLISPAMIFLSVLAWPLFHALLPEKWLPAVPYLQLMCIAGIMYPLHLINLNILQVKGRSDFLLFLEIIKKLLVVIILLISYHYGVIGILIGQIISSVIAYIPNSYFAARLINYSVREQMADFLPGLALSGAVGMLIYTVGHFIHWPAFVQLVAFSSTAGILYIAGAHLLKLKAYVFARQMVTDRMAGRG